MALHTLTLWELQEKFATGDVTAQEIVRGYALRIQHVEPQVKAYLTLEMETATAQAEALDHTPKTQRRAKSLMAMPLAVKDNICTRGVTTTCASKMLEHFVPSYDATVVARLREQEFLLLGKTNLDEFAMGSSTENSAFGPSRNPWKVTCIPGGSSGGSAAAVAADECVAALGSDTGGSIRQPAACCGVVGLKPTYGRVSRYGLVAFASSLDQIGPITKCVPDAAILLNVLAGHDLLDSTSAQVGAQDFTRAFKRKDLQQVTVGVPKEFFGEGIDPEVEGAVYAVIEEFKQLGGRVKEVSLPTTPAATATYYLIAMAEASSNLARYDGVRYGVRSKHPKDLVDLYRHSRQEGFGPEVKRRIMLGTYALRAGYYEAYYAKAQAVRTLMRRDFAAVFQEVDLLITPVMPTPAFELGEKIEDPLTMYLSDMYTISVNLAGLPALSMPCGFSRGGLPIGVQLIGRPFEEEVLLRAGHAYECVTGWHRKRPNLS